MAEKDFYKITDYIASLIKGSEFESHVYAVGGSVRDLLMCNPIKDIDLVIELPGVVVKNILDSLLKMSFVNPNITRETCLKQLPSVYKQILNENKNVKV